MIEDNTDKEDTICALLARIDVASIELVINVEPYNEVKQQDNVDKVGTKIEERTDREDWISICCVWIIFDTIDEPFNVENVPEFNEKDEIINVEFTVNVFTVISELVTVDTFIVEPTSVVK